MLKVDEFESAFRASERRPFRLDQTPLKKVLLITDLGRGSDGPFAEQGGTHASFREAAVRAAPYFGDAEWSDTTGDDYDNVQSLLDTVQKAKPDVICAYRNLKDGSWRWPYSLGVFLNVLTRETPTPVLVLPNPNEFPNLGWARSAISRPMMLADHLAGDDSLVNWGLRFTPPDGSLLLAHVEDDLVFERYMDVISKVPTLDTEVARESILKRLLKEPHDYITSATEAVEKASLAAKVEESVTTGHRLEDFERLIEGHKADLVGVHTSDQDQVALHGTTYLLAVKLRSIPLLML